MFYDLLGWFVEAGTSVSAFFNQLSKEHAHALEAKENDNANAWWVPMMTW
jgi:hypothetical protein